MNRLKLRQLCAQPRHGKRATELAVVIHRLPSRAILKKRASMGGSVTWLVRRRLNLVRVAKPSKYRLFAFAVGAAGGISVMLLLSFSASAAPPCGARPPRMRRRYEGVVRARACRRATSRQTHLRLA